MSEKQETHTPGPWVVKHDEKGLPFIGVKSDPWTYNGTIASVDTSEKDARLIAAAPEMLEVLQEILEPCPVKGYLGKYDHRRTYKARKKARAILDRVEGETV